MDSDRVDSLARFLAHTGPRRSVLGAVGGATISEFLALGAVSTDAKQGYGKKKDKKNKKSKMMPCVPGMSCGSPSGSPAVAAMRNDDFRGANSCVA